MRSGIPRKGLPALWQSNVDLYAEVSTIFDLVVTFVGIISLVGSSYYMLSMAYCVYSTRPEGRVRVRVSCSKVRNTPLKACSKWFTKYCRPENARVV